MASRSFGQPWGPHMEGIRGAGAILRPTRPVWPAVAPCFRALQAGAKASLGQGVAASRADLHPSSPSPSLGECGPAQMEAIQTLLPESLISCQLQFKPDVFDRSRNFITLPTCL